jgi:hypothetical protein
MRISVRIYFCPFHGFYFLHPVSNSYCQCGSRSGTPVKYHEYINLLTRIISVPGLKKPHKYVKHRIVLITPKNILYSPGVAKEQHKINSARGPIRLVQYCILLYPILGRKIKFVYSTNIMRSQRFK